MSWVSQGIDALFGGGSKPDPRTFANGTPVPPMTTGPQSPLSLGGGPLTPVQTSAFDTAMRMNPDLAGVWDTIKGSVGDVGGWIKDHFPDMNLGDIAGWIRDHGDQIESVFKDASVVGNVVNQYQRQQQSDKYAKQALDLATKSYADKAPLRMAGQAGMLDPHKGTPDLSSLSAQGQRGSSIQAPLPLAAPQTAYQNAGSIAGNNPFAKGLPMAPAPVSGTPAVPGGPPGGGFTPKPPTPLPLGPPGQLSPTPGVGGAPPPVPGGLPMAPQSGPIAAGPQNRTLPKFPSGLPQYGLSPLPLAGG